MRTIELSCDLGEAADARGLRIEEEIWNGIAAANVACGGHAGDAASMREAASRAARLGVVLGAHPSYPDREGFGRRRMEISPAALRESLIAQIGALRSAASGAGARVTRVKPHGALYNEAFADEALAATVVDAIVALGDEIAIVAQPGSMLLAAARRGMRTIREAFADRAYALDGSLVPRGRAGALLTDFGDAAAQALRLAREGTVLTGARAVAVEFDTLCIHGDMEGAVGRLAAIRGVLTQEGFTLGTRR
ncbi:MAG TPA: 5-oxoprolinase subunit PxpA [Thermoanaerobaculia bacterium]|nr:5-oxoprolinase subunit PxpA [Thermoanaerobaculia bacterium]